MPEVHERSLEIVSTTEDNHVVVELAATDPDTDYITLVVTQLPAHGKLYKVNADGTKGDQILEYSDWEVRASAYRVPLR